MRQNFYTNLTKLDFFDTACLSFGEDLEKCVMVFQLAMVAEIGNFLSFLSVKNYFIKKLSLKKSSV